MKHTTHRHLYAIGFSLLLFTTAQAQITSTPAIEIQADRTLIYPDQMELSAEATVWDVLQLYPDLLQEGFDQVLTNYQLRLDNIMLSGDARLVLSQIKTSEVKNLQICENPGVAKGTTGTGGIIDIRLKPAPKGASGLVEAQAGTDSYLAPAVKLRYGDERNDLFVYSSHTNLKTMDGQLHTQKDFLHTQLNTHFSDHDELQTVFYRQSKKDEDVESSSQTDQYRLRIGYTHTFNDLGTSLLLVANYQHSKTPESNMGNTAQTNYMQSCIYSDLPFGVVELNTPLFVKGSSLMIGWEGDFSRNRYHHEQIIGELTLNRKSDYHVTNNDLYAQLVYPVGNVSFSVGDRIMFFHYGLQSEKERWEKNSTHHMLQTSFTWQPNARHQLQGGYYRKFINPAYMKISQEAWPDETGSTWSVGNNDLTVTNVGQVKLAYSYTLPRLVVNAGLNYYHTSDIIKTEVLDEGLTTWVNSDKANAWKADLSLFYRLHALSLTAGATLNSINYIPDETNQESRITYATFRLTPVLSLPCSFRAEGQFVFFTTKTPWRIANENVCTYGALRLSKAFGNHLLLAAEWHDMFQSSRSAALGTISYRF